MVFRSQSGNVTELGSCQQGLAKLSQRLQFRVITASRVGEITSDEIANLFAVVGAPTVVRQPLCDTCPQHLSATLLTLILLTLILLASFGERGIGKWFAGLSIGGLLQKTH